MPAAKTAQLECSQEAGPGSCCGSWDLYPILSPFATCLNFPVCPRASPPEGPGGASRDKNWGCVPKKVLQKEDHSGCLHQPSSCPLRQLALRHPLHLPQRSRVNCLEGSLEPLTHLQGIPVCASQNPLETRTQCCLPLVSPDWPPSSKVVPRSEWGAVTPVTSLVASHSMVCTVDFSQPCANITSRTPQ